MEMNLRTVLLCNGNEFKNSFCCVMEMNLRTVLLWNDKDIVSLSIWHELKTFFFFMDVGVTVVSKSISIMNKYMYVIRVIYA